LFVLVLVHVHVHVCVCCFLQKYISIPSVPPILGFR
jgi:hypothetical protein